MNNAISPIRLYRFALSGHAHRAQLMLSLLGLPHELIDIDLIAGDQKQPGFLARNAFGQVPVIEDGDFTLADSNAILVYLALTYDAQRSWLPQDARTQANVQRWLGVAAGPLASGAAHARFATIFNRPLNPQAQPTARKLFEVFEGQLEGRTWLATHDHPTIADVAMYSYTAHAPEGGVSLEPCPRVRAWLDRVEALPGFVGMARSRIPETA
jgi:glutathione S-transferase